MTLVEVLTVMVILGIIASLTIGVTVSVRRHAKERATQSLLQRIAMALEEYHNDFGAYPPSWYGTGKYSGGHWPWGDNRDYNIYPNRSPAYEPGGVKPVGARPDRPNDFYGIRNLYLAMGGHRACSVCGYIYDSEYAGRDSWKDGSGNLVFGKLPSHGMLSLDDPRRSGWKCPICASGRDRYGSRRDYLQSVGSKSIGRGVNKVEGLFWLDKVDPGNINYDPDPSVPQDEITQNIEIDTNAAIIDAWGQPLFYYNYRSGDPFAITGTDFRLRLGRVPDTESYDYLRDYLKWLSEHHFGNGDYLRRLRKESNYFHEVKGEYILLSFGPPR